MEGFCPRANYITVRESAAPIRTRSASKRSGRLRSLALRVLMSGAQLRTVI
jgi:hypothetical protein